MDAERYQRVKQLLLETLERPAQDRLQWLAGVCGDDLELRHEVEALLAEEDSGHALLDDGVLGPGTSGHLRATIQRMGEASALPTRIGPYEIVGVLGEGGMGMVYHGRQSEPVSRDVAVKVLRPGLDGVRVLARFEWERKALARLDHPNIARILDAGTDPATQRPYVALPLIDGEPITRYCERAEPSLERRLQLFLRVCRAVEHAHARGVLHRDIKPGNVLVQEIDGEAVPIVIDFGIAKALDPDTTGIDATMTVEGQRIGTPAYMSPEQLHGDVNAVDVRSDVYALGVILWEILSGQHPFGDAVESVTLALQVGKEPPALAPPSRASTRSLTSVDRWRRRLRGDLDTICLRAVEFDRSRRYASAAHLADDVQRFLDGRPILARPDSWTYRLGKSARRHPVLTTALAGAAAVLLTGTTLLGLNAQRLEQERDRALDAERRARTEANQARAISDFLSSMFTEVDPVMGDAADLSARELLQQGARRAREDLAGEPELRAPLLYTLGFVLHQLGQYAEAESLLVASLVDVETIDLADGERDSIVAETYRILGITRHDQGRYAEGEAAARRVLELYERLYGRDDPRYSAVLGEVAIDVQAQGRLDEALELLLEALALLEDADEPIQSEIAWTRGTIGYVLSQLDRQDEALIYLQSAYDIMAALPEDERNPFEYVYALNNLGGMNRILKNYDEARRYLGEALERSVAIHGEDHALVARAYANLGGALLAAGDVDAAAPMIEKGYAINMRLLGPEHVLTTNTMLSMASLRNEQRRFDEGVEHARTAYETRERILAPSNPRIADARLWVARLLLAAGDADAALSWAEGALEQYRSVHQSDHLRVLESRTARAWALLELGRAAEAREELAGLPEALRARQGDEDAWTRRAVALSARLAGER